jgi:hypothetical protein
MIGVTAAIAAAGIGAIVAAGGTAMGLTAAQEQELAARIAAGVRPSMLRLNDVAIEDYKRRPGEADATEFLVIRKDGEAKITLADRGFTMRNLQVGGGPGPNAIFIGFSGGGHCCYTAHLIWIEGRLRHQEIELRESQLKVVPISGPPQLHFYDFAFAEWNATFADSPAPQVILHYDYRRGEYVADAAAMRQTAPDAASLQLRATEIRKVYEGLRPGDLDSVLWAGMLEMIYAGNAASARALLDAAWPPERPGKDAFLADFTKQLWRGTTWRRFELGRVLGAAEAFPAPAETR